MMNAPKGKNADERPATDGATAVDYVRTEREAEAEIVKRKAEEKLAKASQGGQAGASASDRRKKGGEPDDTLQNTTDEPIVEDEP